MNTEELATATWHAASRADDAPSILAAALRQHREEFVALDGQARLATVVLDLIDMGETVRESRGYTFTVAQGELGRRAGLSRAYTSTVLNEWKRDDLLTTFGRTTVIRDAARLRKIARAP